MTENQTPVETAEPKDIFGLTDSQFSAIAERIMESPQYKAFHKDPIEYFLSYL